jgi:hypothetical protein
MEHPMKTLRARFFLHLSFAVLVFGVTAAGAWAGQSSKKTESSAAEKSAKGSTVVDLNTASEKELVDLPGVGPATAKKIIAGRPYLAVSDLSKAGVSASTITKITPLVTVTGGAASAASAKAPAAATSKTSAKESAPAPPPAPAPISQPAPAPAKPAAAPASQGTLGAGQVWVNLESGVYHYPQSKFYGKTKSGKYMSEADAVKAGYHAAKNEKKNQ